MTAYIYIYIVYFKRKYLGHLKISGYRQLTKTRLNLSEAFKTILGIKLRNLISDKTLFAGPSSFVGEWLFLHAFP